MYFFSLLVKFAMTEGNAFSGFNFHLFFAVVASAFGSGFQHGYNTGVLNEIQNVTMEWIRDCRKDSPDCRYTMAETTFIWAWVVSIFCLGGLCGGLSVGLAAAGIGRKNSLLANNVFVFAGGIMMALAKWANKYAMLIGGRFLIGISAGFAAGLTPMYLSEISPASVRGAVGTVYQLTITCSILLSQVLGVKYMLGSSSLWPYLLGLTMAPAIFQVLSLPFCPESPGYLMNKKDEEGAIVALMWLRNKKNVSPELEELIEEREQETETVTLRKLFSTPSLRQPLGIAVMMMLAQQLTGINAIVFYSTEVFVNAGLSHQNAQFATIGLGLANVLMTIFAIFIIEKVGRKTLLVTGLIGMCLATIALLTCLVMTGQEGTGKETSYLLSMSSVISLVTYIVFFAWGPGPIPWFLVSELFNQSARPLATSVAVGVNWFANFCISWAFQPIEVFMGPYVFVIFVVTMVFFIVYIVIFVPETKDKTILEITSQFK